MTPVALGLPLDHASPRRYFGTPRGSERPRRALAERITLLLRSHATLHRRHWWITERNHPRYSWSPPETCLSTQQEAT